MRISRTRVAVTTVLILCAAVVRPPRAAGQLKIYFIDVEGGQSTLVVTPRGQSLLVDAGYGDPPGRDPQRILAAAKDAGIARIDYLLLTHFHGDHIGGVPELARSIEIAAVIDHDTILVSDPVVTKPFNELVAVRERIKKHIIARPGDRLPLDGVDAVVVSSAGATLQHPLEQAGARNPACGPSPQPAAEAGENPRSTGFRLKAGSFSFLDLGDLSGRPLYSLVCPNNLVGRVDVYLVPHHGNDDVTDPATFAAFDPRVAVVNNGPTKGGAPSLIRVLQKIEGLDSWQLHRSDNPGAANVADDHIANVDDRSAYWIKLVANEDGSFSVANGRTGMTKKYQRR